jgi:hypothetical protein
VLGIDLFNIGPWLAQARATKNDLHFYELMEQYLASLNDPHNVYQLPSTFEASLNYTVDIYDGKLLVAIGFHQSIAPARVRFRVREQLRVGFGRPAGFPDTPGWPVAIRNPRQPSQHQATGSAAPKAAGTLQGVIDQYELVYKAVLAANTPGQTITDSLPLCTSSLLRAPFMDSDGNVLGYMNQIMVLIDQFSTSTADSVPGMLRDANPVSLYGMRKTAPEATMRPSVPARIRKALPA